MNLSLYVYQLKFRNLKTSTLSMYVFGKNQDPYQLDV